MRTMKALDLFCGLGGWSDGLALEGFEVLGVEIEPKIAELYKHKVIVADVRNLDGKDFQGFDLIVGSPPCRDFSTASCANKTRKGRKPPNPERGLELIRAFRKFVDDANPQFWLMENVPRTTKFYTTEKPILSFRVGKHSKRLLWGNVSFPLMFDFRFSRVLQTDYGKLKWCDQSALKAKIPLPVARALGRAVKNKLNGV